MNTKIDELVRGWIAENREQLAKDIITMVNIKSVSEKGTPEGPYGQGCLDALHAMLKLGEGYGFQSQNYEEHMGSLSMETGGETIGFWGHLDVVPEGSGWDYAPYNAVIEDDFLIGRGSHDNKGQTMAVLYTMRCIHELGIPLKHNLKLWLGCNEEAGMADLIYYREHYPVPDFNIIADSNYPVCYGEKGIIAARICADNAFTDILDITGGTASNIMPDEAVAILRKTARLLEKLPVLRDLAEVTEQVDTVTVRATGISRHTAFPTGGINAVYKLTSALCESGALSEEDQRLLSFYTEINSDFEGAGLHIAFSDEMSGPLTAVGSLADTREGHFNLSFNIRYPVTDDPIRIQQGIFDTAAKGGCIVEFDRVDPAHYFPKEHPIVDLMTGVFNEVTGLDKKPFVLPGGTYARKLKNAISFGMGGLTYPDIDHLFRPGHGGAHGPDECTYLPNLEESIRIYIHSLLAIDDMDFSTINSRY